MKVSLNSYATYHGNLMNDIRVAREAGFEGIEPQNPKLRRYAESGMDWAIAREALKGLELVGIGPFLDIERADQPDREFERDMTWFVDVAVAIGAPMIEICTGPIDNLLVKEFKKGTLPEHDDRYRGYLGKTETELLKGTAKRLKKAGKIAGDRNVSLDLEPVACAPLNRLNQAVKAIDMAGCGNIGLVLDIWHMWSAGDTPDDVAKLDKKIIKNVHFCDGLEFDRTWPPHEESSRDVWTGGGDIPLKRWVEAIKSTGYDGWFSCEAFCKKALEEDLVGMATALRMFTQQMLL